MNKFLLLLSLVVYVECNGQLTASIDRTGGYGYGDSSQYQKQQLLTLRQLLQPQYYQQHQPQIVEVQNEEIPIKVLFRAKSPKIQVEQINEPSERGSIQKTRTDEEPHRLLHEVHRPVIQEIREVIQPYRRVIQEIQPVIEQVQTVVARGDGRANNGQNGQGLVLSQQSLQLNDQYNGNSDSGKSDLGGLSNLGYSASTLAELWANAKALSRSRSD